MDMKKYKLIEYNINHQKGVRLGAEYNSLEQAVDALIILQKNNLERYYRIEEVEESIIDRVKSYEDACEVLGKTNIDESHGGAVVRISDARGSFILDPKNGDHIITLLKLETIIAALNEGWKPDWEDKDQKRYGVYYDLSLEDLYISCERDIIKSPSQLLFKSYELAEYAAKQFAELYKQLLVEKF